MRQWLLAVPTRLRYFLQHGMRSQRPLYIGKPTLTIEALQHVFGIALVRCLGFLVAVGSLFETLTAALSSAKPVGPFQTDCCPMTIAYPATGGVQFAAVQFCFISHPFTTNRPQVSQSQYPAV